MLCRERFLFFFLWFVTIIYCDDSIVKNVQINQKTKKIHISNFAYNILTKTEKDGLPIDEVNAFALVTSCSAAEWTIFYLCEFVLKFQLFHSRKFFNKNYKSKLIENLKLMKDNNMLDNISKSIQLLDNVMENTLDPLYYNDKSIFTTLVLLEIKIDDIITKKNASIDSDVIVIQEMLEEMNAIQLFLSSNCDNANPGDVKYSSQMYGYTITKPVENFISNLQLNYKTISYKKCTSEQILLQQFLGIQLEDPEFARDIGKSKSNILNKEIKDVFKQIQLSYDLTMIYFYMKSIFGAIIKLLYNTLMEGMQKNYLTKPINDTIEKIYNIINISNEDYPTELLQAFKYYKSAVNRINTTENEYSKLILGLYRQYKQYSEIQLGKYQLTIDDVNDMSKKQGDYNVEEMNELTFQEYLNKFLGTIENNLIHFICFNKYFRYFKNEFDKKYLFYSNFELNNVIKESKDDDRNYDKCYFIIDMYYMCYNSVVFLNRINIDINPDNNLKTAKTIIYDVRNYFYHFIKTKSNNLDFHQMGNDIVIALANLPTFVENSESLTKKQVEYLKRIVNYIMAKINSWTLKYCPYPTFPFLLFNNAHLNKYIEENTREMYKNLGEYKTSNTSIEPQNYQCFNYNYLYNTFVKKKTQSQLKLEIFEKFIILKWKRKDTSIEKVYNDFNYLILDFHDLKSFYHIYFIYHIAIIYYQMKLIIEKTIPVDLKNDKIDTERSIDCPQYLKHLVSQIMNLEKNMYAAKVDFQKNKQIADAIENEFTIYHIIFKDSDSDSDNDKILKKDVIKNRKSTTDEIIQNVSMLFNNCYLKIKFDAKKHNMDNNTTVTSETSTTIEIL